MGRRRRKQRRSTLVTASSTKAAKVAVTGAAGFIGSHPEETCCAAGVRQSMSAVGSSADNALAESFNATFKRETLQARRAFSDDREARLASFRWLHRYNTVRRHSRLGQQSPITYENTAATSTMVAAAA